MPEERDFILSHRARVVLPDAARISVIRKLVGDRFSDDEIYPWDAEISNDLLDSHYTHMSDSTLINYAEDAIVGVAFLRGHNWHELPVGYSVDAEIGKEKKRQRVMAGFYTVRGIADTDDLIKRMEAKLLRDVSVGFHGGRMVCDLCGQDFWDCRHFPGLKYETKESDVVKTELATFTIEDARLSEVSGVFDGSTPEAMIRKAQMFTADGLLDKKQIEVLEQRYRTRLAVPKTWAITPRGEAHLEELKKKETRKMSLEELMAESAAIRTLLKVGLEGDPRAAIETLQGRVVELEPQARDGVQYRSDLVTQALVEGVRAHGNDFKTEEYKNILSSAPLDTIKSMGVDWKKVADASLPTGRRSEDTMQPVPVASIVPDEAYA